MSAPIRIKGISLKVGPLGENDRLLTLLSDSQGIIRLAVPGARRPKSSLSAAAPLTFLDLQITGNRGLKKIKQIKILKSFNKLGSKLETLAAAQSLAELSLLLVGSDDPQPEIFQALLIHLERLEKQHPDPLRTLAKAIQSYVHLLALGGYSLPMHDCSSTGKQLNPPIGNWDWICSFNPLEGFSIGTTKSSIIQLNASELALLQRLLRPTLPLNNKGELLGPIKTWLKLLKIVEAWIEIQLPRNLCAMTMLKNIFINMVD